MHYLLGYYSDKGIKKPVNQDALIIRTCKSPYGRIGLFAVCDGMGGLSQGELASATVVEALSEWFDSKLKEINFDNVCKADIFEIIGNIVCDINSKMFSYGKKNSEKLGTTMSLLLTVDDKYYICQVGDSRVYKLDDEINLLTRDQSFVAREVELGNITEEQAKTHPKRSVLLKCIGAKQVLEPEYYDGTLKGNEMFIVCSDGFYRRLEKEEIKDELKPHLFVNNNQLTEKAEGLVQKVMTRKEIDNISVILIKTIE